TLSPPLGPNATAFLGTRTVAGAAVGEGRWVARWVAVDPEPWWRSTHTPAPIAPITRIAAMIPSTRPVPEPRPGMVSRPRAAHRAAGRTGRGQAWPGRARWRSLRAGPPAAARPARVSPGSAPWPARRAW